jgi:hypothetical protein
MPDPAENVPLAPLHNYWAGIGGASFVVGGGGLIVLYATPHATELPYFGLVVALAALCVFIGIYGMFGVYFGLPLPEPKRENIKYWRAGALAIVLLGVATWLGQKFGLAIARVTLTALALSIGVFLGSLTSFIAIRASQLALARLSFFAASWTTTKRSNRPAPLSTAPPQGRPKSVGIVDIGGKRNVYRGNRGIGLDEGIRQENTEDNVTEDNEFR